MNKTAKGILIGAGVLVLLSGALVALKLTEPDSGTASGSSLSSQEDHSTLLWELDEKDIKSVAVTFGTDSYTILPEVLPRTTMGIQCTTTPWKIPQG